MSCRTTSGGTLATRLARVYSGLPDGVVTSLFHALKREGQSLPEPTEEEVEDWQWRQRALIDNAPLSDRDRERSELDLLRARYEEIDPATFYAWHRLEVRARQEAVVREMKGYVVDLEPPGSQADQYQMGPDGRPARVWYASYGSNLSSERFLTYIKGGTPTGSSTTHEGCRDDTDPLDDVPIRYSGRMHFAATSGRWGGGGVAFMDNDGAGHALGRAYLISMEQFDDVVAQENGRTVGAIKADTAKTIRSGSSQVATTLYGRMVHIGDYQGAPVFTFTGDFSSHEALMSARGVDKGSALETTNAPSNNYVRMIGKGLEQTFGMTVPQQADYLRGCLGLESTSRKALIAILESEPDPVGAAKKAPSRRSLGSSPLTGSSYLDDEQSNWWNDPHFASTTTSTRPTTPASSPMLRTSKPCPICGKAGHTMHDCPALKANEAELEAEALLKWKRDNEEASEDRQAQPRRSARGGKGTGKPRKKPAAGT